MSSARPLIRPLVTGDCLAPDGPKAGSRILVVAYLVRTADLTVLFDTGFPWDGPTVHSEPDVDIETYPRSLADALKSARASLDQVRQGLLSNLANPKILVLSASLLPQFGLSVADLLTGYSLAVARIGDILSRGSVRRAIEATTGTVLVALGVRLATEPA